MALSADKITKSKGDLHRQAFPVDGGSVIYAGGLVCLNDAGYAVPAADTAGLSKVVGVATAKADNAAGADGAVKVIVEFDGRFLLDVGAGITQVDVGRSAFVTDDETLTDDGGASNDIYAGEICEFLDESQDKAWVYIPGLSAGGGAGAGIPSQGVFVSSEQTGTGSSQNVAHGLGRAPEKVLVAVTEHPGAPDTGAFDIAEGAHDATNVVLTVTANVKFKVLAWA